MKTYSTIFIKINSEYPPLEKGDLIDLKTFMLLWCLTDDDNN